MNSSLRNTIAALTLASVASLATANDTFEPDNIRLSQAEITKICNTTNSKFSEILHSKNLCEVSINGGTSWTPIEKSMFASGGAFLLALIASGAIILRLRKRSATAIDNNDVGAESTVLRTSNNPVGAESVVSRLSSRAKSLTNSLFFRKKEPEVTTEDLQSPYGEPIRHDAFSIKEILKEESPYSMKPRSKDIDCSEIVNGSDITISSTDGSIYKKNTPYNHLNKLNATIPEYDPIIFPNGDAYFGIIYDGSIQEGTITTSTYKYIGEFLFMHSDNKVLHFSGYQYDLYNLIVEDSKTWRTLYNVGPTVPTLPPTEGDNHTIDFRSNNDLAAGLAPMSLTEPDHANIVSPTVSSLHIAAEQYPTDSGGDINISDYTTLPTPVAITEDMQPVPLKNIVSPIVFPLHIASEEHPTDPDLDINISNYAILPTPVAIAEDMQPVPLKNIVLPSTYTIDSAKVIWPTWKQSNANMSYASKFGNYKYINFQAVEQPKETPTISDQNPLPINTEIITPIITEKPTTVDNANAMIAGHEFVDITSRAGIKRVRARQKIDSNYTPEIVDIHGNILLVISVRGSNGREILNVKDLLTEAKSEITAKELVSGKYCTIK